MKRFMMSIPDEIHEKIESERKSKGQISIQETVREMIAEYFNKRSSKNS